MANLIDLRAERAMRQSDLEAAHRLAAQSREVNGPDHPINADYYAWITNRTEALDAATAALAAAEAVQEDAQDADPTDRHWFGTERYLEA